jgi:hypothetical protein
MLDGIEASATADAFVVFTAEFSCFESSHPQAQANGSLLALFRLPQLGDHGEVFEGSHIAPDLAVGGEVA